MHSGLFSCLAKLGAKWAELVQKFVPRSRVGIFHSAPDPSHWTLNSHFGVFRTFWVNSGPFSCLTKLGAYWAELVQKFVPRSRVGIFRNKHMQSTPCDPKLTFWCVHTIWGIRDRLVALRNSVQNRPNLCKSSCHEVASEYFATNAPDQPH